MTTRSIYRSLLRLHPPRFREQFEEEMLWIFDEVTLNRSAVPLLMDACFSVIRQWVFRPASWRRNGQPAALAGGGAVSPDEIRRNSRALHQRAWRVNLAWAIASMVIYCNNPDSRSWLMDAMVFLLVTGSVVWICKLQKEGRFTSKQIDEPISLFSDPRRNQLVRERDSIRDWARGGVRGWPRSMGAVAVLFFFLMGFPMGLAFFQWIVDRSFPADINRFRFGANVAGFVILAVWWSFVRKLNDRAADALEQEIELVDAPEKENTRTECTK